MSKTKTKNATAVAVAVDPRAAMKLVRSQVSNAVKTGQRVDLMGYRGDDVARAMIALQDLHEAEKLKKDRASQHIVELKSNIGILGVMSTMVINDSNRKTVLASKAQTTMTRQQDVLMDECNRLSKGWNEQIERNSELHQANDELQVKLDAALTTIQTLMGS